MTLSDTGNGPDCPTASIDWGDGTPADASGKVTCSDDGHDGYDYELVASHTYTSAGRFHITIAYGPDRSGEAWAEIRDADVPPPPPAATPTATPAPVAPTPTATATPTPTPTFHADRGRQARQRHRPRQAQGQQDLRPAEDRAEPCRSGRRST